MKVSAYNHVSKTTFVKLGAADVSEVQSVNFKKNCRVAGTFANDKRELAGMLVCLQSPSLLTAAYHSLFSDAFSVCM